jgi:hypothetical protein
MHAGKVLACDAPHKLIESRGSASLEEAFIGYMEDAIGGAAEEKATASAPPAAQPATATAPPKPPGAGLSLERLLAYTQNETMQILRDPVRLAFAFVGSALLMLVFGFGITTDVEHIRYAALDLDQTPESRAYLEQFAGSSRYFVDTPPARSAAEAQERLQSNEIAMIPEMPPSFGRDLRKGSGPEVSALVDGANPFRGETIAQYAQGVQARMRNDPASGLDIAAQKYTADIQERYTYIRRAELNAAAQSARIGVAKADLYPRFSLVGEIGFETSSHGGLQSGNATFGYFFNGDSLFYSYGPLENNVRVQDARFQQLLVNYQNPVLIAAREVEDGLIGFLKAQEAAAFEQNSVDAARRSVQISLAQYREGAVDYERVLDSQRSLLERENSLAEIRSSIATNLIALYKALGGGWELRQGQPIVAPRRTR